MVSWRKHKFACLSLMALAFGLSALTFWYCDLSVPIVREVLHPTDGGYPRPSTLRTPSLVGSGAAASNSNSRGSELTESGGSPTGGRAVTLAMHMAAVPHLVQNLYCIVFRSAVVFWPRRLGSIGLILDEESAEDHKLAAEIQKHGEELGIRLTVKYQPLPADPEMFGKASFAKHRGRGYQRQLWNTYFLDEYIDTPVIAYTDTDVMLSTPVTPEAIFNGDKLRVYVGNVWGKTATLPEVKAAFAATGKKMVGKCDPFPTYLWRDTVTNCRKYIMKHLNVTRFEDVFRELHVNNFAANPMKTIMTYAYYFEHDRYDWHFDVPASDLDRFNAENVSPGGPPVTLDDIVPTVVVTTHKPSIKRGSPFKQGYCTALAHTVATLPAWCEAFRNTTDLHLFRTVTGPSPSSNQVAYGWCRKGDNDTAATRPVRVSCRELSERHYRTVAGHQRAEALYDFSMERVAAVERMAAQMNTTCPPLMKPPRWVSDTINHAGG